ncbi:ribosome-binding factor A [Candidatus Kaiserbacteria bacterium]|nr:ribosome-binding factor A [Candidatus Kaiserbacteria bacterium]
MSERHERVISLIRELAAAYIAREANTDPLITITRVSTSPDYRNVTIFITTIPEGREADALIFLKRHGGELRHYIKKTSNLKIIPQIDFDLDVGERHRQHIDELTNEIHKNDEQ